MARPKLDKPRDQRIKLVDANDEIITTEIYNTIVSFCVNNSREIYIDDLDYRTLEKSKGSSKGMGNPNFDNLSSLKKFLANNYPKTLTFIVSCDYGEY